MPPSFDRAHHHAPESTDGTFRRFCRAKMTHLGQRCPAIRNARGRPRHSPRGRTLRISTRDPTSPEPLLAADFAPGSPSAARMTPQWPWPLSGPVPELGASPHAAGAAIPASETPRRSTGTRFCGVDPQDRLSKIAQDARSAAREGIGTARGAQSAFNVIYAGSHHHPCSATARTPIRHPSAAASAGRGRFPRTACVFHRSPHHIVYIIHIIRSGASLAG